MDEFKIQPDLITGINLQSFILSGGEDIDTVFQDFVEPTLVDTSSTSRPQQSDDASGKCEKDFSEEGYHRTTRWSTSSCWMWEEKKASVENNRNGRKCGNAPLGFRAPVRSRVRNGLRLAEPFRHPLCDTLTVKVIPGRFSFDSEEATTPKGRRVAVGFRPLFISRGRKGVRWFQFLCLVCLPFVDLGVIRELRCCVSTICNFLPCPRCSDFYHRHDLTSLKDLLPVASGHVILVGSVERSRRFASCAHFVFKNFWIKWQVLFSSSRSASGISTFTCSSSALHTRCQLFRTGKFC